MRFTAVHPVLVALLILVAGCTGASPSIDGTATSTTRSTSTPIPTTDTTSTTTPTRTTLTPAGEVLPDDYDHIQKTFPSPPEELTVASAVRAARQYEEAYLHQHFSNRSDVERFGLTPTTAGEDAYVVDRTDVGYYVRVQHPFSYTTGDAHADGASHALYVVNTAAIRRVSADYPN